MTRPLPVTVIAWIIIAISLEGLITLVGGVANSIFTSGTVHTGLSLSATLWAGGIALVANLVLGGLILAGLGWARIAYMAILAIGLLGMVFQTQPAAIAAISGVKIVVFGYFFFRRESNEYFAKVAPSAT